MAHSWVRELRVGGAPAPRGCLEHSCRKPFDNEQRGGPPQLLPCWGSACKTAKAAERRRSTHVTRVGGAGPLGVARMLYKDQPCARWAASQWGRRDFAVSEIALIRDGRDAMRHMLPGSLRRRQAQQWRRHWETELTEPQHHTMARACASLPHARNALSRQTHKNLAPMPLNHCRRCRGSCPRDFVVGPPPPSRRPAALPPPSL